MTDLRVTQVGAETWVVPNRDLVVTQVGAEAWYAVTPALIVTQVGAEEWQSVEVLTRHVDELSDVELIAIATGSRCRVPRWNGTVRRGPSSV